MGYLFFIVRLSDCQILFLVLILLLLYEAFEWRNLQNSSNSPLNNSIVHNL